MAYDPHRCWVLIFKNVIYAPICTPAFQLVLEEFGIDNINLITNWMMNSFFVCR
jgi:hypothetical protein